MDDVYYSLEMCVRRWLEWREPPLYMTDLLRRIADEENA